MDSETQVALQKARRLTSGSLQVDVSWEAIAGLALRVAVDRGYDVSAEFGAISVPDFFSVSDAAAWEAGAVDPQRAVAWLEAQDRHNVVYLELLVRLFTRRLKYRRILSTQAFATSDQIGPRTLLEHGLLDEHALSSLVVWRKWMMDIDNRSGQETGYLYDAIVARALGGTAYGSRNSPIHRKPPDARTEPLGRRQVDCVVENGRGFYAYEVKIRITDAASRQGRLNEELSFPADCKYSNHVPRLLVFDPTPCTTLDTVVAAFEREGGEVFLGQAAYDHIGATAGPAHAEFLRRYVAEPLKKYEDTIPDFGAGRALADLRLSAAPEAIRLEIAGFDPYIIERDVEPGTVVDELDLVDEKE
ncbi:MAG TPA: hypothetical protein VHV75_11275 [Solirubrobacteraceae bacterium]|jgi:hypothetical protein|nr:hypothetical protein [Solirubrobacteraceae bacterium]